MLFDGTKFIAVGEKIVYSSDGRNWTEAANVANRYVQSITFGHGLYLITGDHTVLSSRDGTNWIHEHPALSEISAVSYGSERFVAFGEGANGRIALLSTNENKWSSAALPPGAPITTSIYAQDRFIAFSESDLITSVDGVTWDTMPPVLNGTPIAAQFANGEYFLAVQDGLNGRLYHGAALTNLIAAATFENSSLRALVVSGPTIVLAGGIYPQATVLHVSIDSGASWQAIPTLNPIRALASGNGRFVAAGDYSYVMSSTNALQWRERFLTNTWFKALAFGGNSFVAAGSLGVRNGPAPRGIWSSTDGETWIAHPVPAVGDIDAIAFGGREWVLVGPYGLVLRSAPVGPFFRSEQLFSTQQTLGLAIDNTPGQRAILESSPDLRNWTEVTNSTDQSFSIEVPRNLPGQFFRLRE